LILFGQQSPLSDDYGSRSGQILAWQDPALFSGVIGQNEENKVAIALPYGVTDVDLPASIAFYDGRTYIVGGYSANIVIDETYTAWRQGINPPTEPPSISGGGGNAGTAYWTFYDIISGERSSLSGGVPCNAGSGTRVWTNLPARPPDDVFIAEGTVYADFSNSSFYTEDPRTRHFYLRPGDLVKVANAPKTVSEVSGPRYFSAHPFGFGSDSSGQSLAALPLTRATHIEFWIEEAGDFPRLITRTPLGATELRESSTLATRGEAFQDNFQRFPYCTVNAIYHDRQIMAGNPDAPDTVYISELFQPERYTGLNFRTRNGENVVSIIATRDYCLVLTDKSSYILQGYTESDFTFTVADPNIGAITHVGNMVIHGYPYVWTQEGPYMYTGSWNPLSPENRHWFRDCVQSPSVFFSEAAAFYLGSSPAYAPSEGRFHFWRATHDPTFNSWIVGGTVVIDYTTILPQSGGGFAPARISVDSTEVRSQPPGNAQIYGVSQHTSAYMKQRPEDKYGNQWMIFKKPNPYADVDSTPAAGPGNMICRSVPGGGFANDWYDYEEPA
jgi:hypothetical protein